MTAATIARALYPTTGSELRSDLIPDAVFGLEYREGGARSYRFFVVEADRGTEPARASTFNRKSHLRNVIQYREYVGRGLYRDHFVLTAPLVALNVTSSEAPLTSMLKVCAETSSGGNTYQLYKSIDAFGGYFKPGSPIRELLEEPWKRAGCPDLHIRSP